MFRRLILSVAAVALLAGVVPSVAFAGAGESKKDLVQTARKARTFNTLLKAVRIAGLTETLRTGGPFTVFAPTDEAFAKLPPETLRSVLADRELLRSILLYHVVEGAVYAKDVVGLTSAPTLNGGAVSVALQGGSVVLNGNVNVTATDVAASNGVIHVIDSVLLPPSN